MPHKDPEARRAYARAYSFAHRATISEKERAAGRERQRKRQKARREEINAYKREQYALNKEKAKAQVYAWRLANPEKARKSDVQKRAKKPAFYAFLSHRAASLKRNIPFLLTFEQWMTIWEESGKFAERGKNSHNYCMARFGDRGGYEAGNVRICTARENAVERNKNQCGKPYKSHRPHSETTE
jgi:hypothetical protein